MKPFAASFHVNYLGGAVRKSQRCIWCSVGESSSCVHGLSGFCSIYSFAIKIWQLLG
uniref:Uncharacterized protein n=1 Tax=Arundo donax TaxID=35708 RepID=A0A0A9EUW9_ARUDO